MTSQSFRFNQQFFQSRMRAAFEPRTPRNGLLRFLMRALGLGVLVALVVLGAVVGVTLLAVGTLVRLFRERGPTVLSAGRRADPNVMEGEFRVVDKTSLPR
ncbi:MULTISPECIES: hypothetical protein [Lysobacteraceae]|uniref:Uncharacterized protein n=1 Tax=Novilysobacter avium TaxID=2781023 RepID=A0A7S6ULY8_9GAMM|nr:MULTISPECIES: hypothetical protein [Lysobacter]QOW22659.1 hypothetical protein INQ42_03455 [Lysobacter avium]QOW25165.1 hypothetical protein INQ43_03710 [Lysobacter sp. H23M47]